MRLPRFYSPHSDFASVIYKDEIVIDGSVARHMAQVLRLKVGSPVTVFNGEGGEYGAVIRSIAKQSVGIEIQEFVNTDVESRLKITLAQGVSRGERMDYTLQKATELGVTNIIPVNADRTVVNLKGDRSLKRINHWQKIINSACEQCGRNIVPQVAQVENFRNWISAQPNSSRLKNGDCVINLLLHHEAQQSIASFAVSLSNGKSNEKSNEGYKKASSVIVPGVAESSKELTIVLLIGPEGGFSEEERDLAIQAGFKRVHLGPRVLRTETAAIVALSILQSTLGDLC